MPWQLHTYSTGNSGDVPNDDQGRTMARISLIIAFSLLLLLPPQTQASTIVELDSMQLRNITKDKKNCLIVCPLSPIEYNDLHILGSVNIPIELLSDRLPKNRDQQIIFYCHGGAAQMSRQAAAIASSLGFRNVSIYTQGLMGWLSLGYPVVSTDPLPKLMVDKMSIEQMQAEFSNSKNLFILDCNREADAGKVNVTSPRRINIPLEKLQDNLERLPRNAKIAVVANSGIRASAAARYLLAKGWTQVVSVADEK
jgi:rhodanese-related sulfurtransferase